MTTPESTVKPSTKLDKSWARHDQQPHLLVIKPELRKHLYPGERQQWHLYPRLLRKWWENGQVEVQIISNSGKRTRCQVWQLTRHLGKFRCSKEFMQARDWALKTEILKAELCFMTLEEDIRLLMDTVTTGAWKSDPMDARSAHLM